MDDKRDIFESGFEARRRLKRLLEESQKAESCLAEELFDLTLGGVRGMLEIGQEILFQPISVEILPPSLVEAAKNYRRSYAEMMRLNSMSKTVELEIDKIERKTGGAVKRFFKFEKDSKYQELESKLDVLVDVRKELKDLLKTNFDDRKMFATTWFDALLSTPDTQKTQSKLQAAFNCVQEASTQAQHCWLRESARQRERIDESRVCLDKIERLYSHGRESGDRHGI